MTQSIPAVPFAVRKKLKECGCKNVEWETYVDDKWWGYADFGAMNQRVAVTVCLVTGKACIEILAPIYSEDIIV